MLEDESFSQPLHTWVESTVAAGTDTHAQCGDIFEGFNCMYK
jgi:hypothetical protein